MNLWAAFWGAWIILSGIAFAGITLVVAWKGSADLRAMFRDLGTTRDRIQIKEDIDHGRPGNSR